MLQYWTRNDWRRFGILAAGMALCCVSARAHATGHFALDRLAALVGDFAAAPGRIDPRLMLPDCAAPALAWAAGRQNVTVDCPAPVWRVYIPVDALPGASAGPRRAPEPPAVRRGDHVVVEMAGAGFRVGVEAIADADAHGGRVALRNAITGARLTGFVTAAGQIVAAPLSDVDNRR